MDKLTLIRKEKKDCKLYLNQLYDYLKKTTSKKEIQTIKQEILGVEYTKEILTDLIEYYEKGIGDIKLEEITKQNQKDYLNCQSYETNMKDKGLDFSSKTHTLKASLDIINENYLSKEEIYEYLYDYNEIIKLAQKNFDTTIEKVFDIYMKNTNQPHKNNYNYYQRMIKIHILFLNLNFLSLVKDEDFENILATDPEMGEKTKTGELSFLKDKFIIPTDSSRFKKTQIFNFIRNAFFHSNSNELYRITPDCNFVNISLKETSPIPFNIKLHANDIFKLAHTIQKFSHHVTIYGIKNQEDIIIENLSKNYNKCSKELDKLVFLKKYFESKPKQIKKYFMTLLEKDNLNSLEKTDNILSQYGTTKDLKYELSKEQKMLLYKKFKLFEKYIIQSDMIYYVTPIILNYMALPLSKNHYILMDLAISYTYLLYTNKLSLNEITYDIQRDIIDIDNNIQIEKPSVFKYIGKNINDYKYKILYLLDKDEQENYNDILLLRYVFGTICNDETIFIGGIEYKTEFIRNSLTHNKWRGFKNEKGQRCFYLYDDEDHLVDPEKSYWHQSFLYEDLKKTSEDIIEKYKKDKKKSKTKTL